MVVLDEPINHLDIKHQLGLLKLFQEMKEKTILLSIHNIDLAFKFCDQIILMKNGEILAFGKTEEVLSSGNIWKLLK
ncbi:Hemin import ATP-binding protein HmuV [Fusobacterium necrophorum subsp. necrophorum]|nr:Hemin import ATP-binding protein HmuV [Fusobacterium necrophorum subsp. necrophorum]